MDKGFINSTLENEVLNLTRIVTKLADVMIFYDKQHSHQARYHIVPKDNGQYLHGKTREISDILGNYHLHQDIEQIKAQLKQQSLLTATVWDRRSTLDSKVYCS